MEVYVSVDSMTPDLEVVCLKPPWVKSGILSCYYLKTYEVGWQLTCYKSFKSYELSEVKSIFNLVIRER